MDEKTHKEALLLLNKMDARMAENHKEVIRLFEKMDNTLKYIADLIVSKGERTRRFIEEKMKY